MRCNTGLILGLCPANERHWHKVMPSLIGWAPVLEIPTGPPVWSWQLWRRTGTFLLIFLQFYVHDLRFKAWGPTTSLRWRHNDWDGVSNHQPRDCLLNCSFRRRTKKTSKLRITGLCVGNSPGTGEFPAQMASYAENVSIWWRHNVSWLSFKHWWAQTQNQPSWS